MKALASCDDISDDDVCKLVAWAYREQTDIHPFANGNGRTASLFDNCILLALSRPTISFRTPEQKVDPNSTYNKAIAAIDDDISLLERHLKGQLDSARHHPRQIHQAQLDYETLGVALALLIHWIQFNLKSNGLDKDQEALDFCNTTLTTLIIEYENLGRKFNNRANNNNMAQHSFTYNLAERTKAPDAADILELLKVLTGLTAQKWQYYPKHFTARVSIPKDTAAKQKAMLSDYPEKLKVRLCVDKDNKNNNILEIVIIDAQNLIARLNKVTQEGPGSLNKK